MNATGKWARRGVWATLVAVMSIGCSPLTTIAFLFHTDELQPAKYPLRPKTGPKKEKDQEVTVLILVDQSGARPEFAGTSRELASDLSKRLPEEAKANKEKLAVISPSQVDRFKMSNPNWKAMHPTTIGKKLGADYVLDISLANLSLYQAGSANMVYEGRTDVTVDVYEVSSGPGEPLHHYVYPHKYPKTGLVAASDIPVSRFKDLFLEKLALELCRMHLDHKQSDGIASDD